MSEDDFDEFAQMLDDFAALRQLPLLAPSAKALFFRAVARYPLDTVLRAIEAHLIDPEEGKFRTMIQPAHIVAQIEGAAANDGRPGADEAWATAYLASDEAETVVWTTETAQALAVAQSVLAAGDKVGARMAFKSAYDRLVAKARREHRPVHWQPSLGHDPLRREQVLQVAAAAGLLPAPQLATLLLPSDGALDPVDETLARGNIARLMNMLAGALTPGEKRRRQRESVNAAERENLDARKRDAAIRVGFTPPPLWPVADLREADPP